MSEWIKVSEQLPSPRTGQDTIRGLSVVVFIWNPSYRRDWTSIQDVAGCYDYETNTWWNQELLKIAPENIPTHWQRMPEPPEA